MTLVSRAPYRVIYGDTDQMGVVYYANYFAFFERGRCEWMREGGLDYAALEKSGVFLPVVEAHCRYRESARFDDLLIIETRVASTTRIRLSFEYRILREEPDGSETLIAEGSTLHAAIGRDGRPVRLPAEILSRLIR